MIRWIALHGALALGLGLAGVGEGRPVPIVGLALTLGLIACYAAWAPFRARIRALPTSFLVLWHLSRFVGLYFLILHAHGRLPWAFAVPGGIGDLVVATTALLVALPCARLATRGQRAAFLTWNVVGFVDIAFVVVTAARLFFQDRASMIEITRLPLVLLPTFVVPWIFLFHVASFDRVRLAGREPEAG